MTSYSTIIDALERAPSIIVPLVREVPSSYVKRRPSPGKWSAHEHACHLARVEPIFGVRLDEMLSAAHPVISPYNPNTSEPEDILLGMDLEKALTDFAEGRKQLVQRLRELTPDEWQKQGEHGEYNHYSIFIMLRHLAMHDLHHAYLLEILLLNKEWSEEWKAFAGTR